MNSERKFKKYDVKGDYHWKSLSANPFARNLYLKGRYGNILKLLNHLNLGYLQKLVDIGCGDGALSHLMAREGFDVIGIDPSQCAINYAQKRAPNVVFKEGTAYSLPLESSSVDVAVFVEVIEHVEEPIKALEEIFRILKPGGYALISTPIKRTEIPIDKEHIQEWFQSDFQDLVKKVIPSCSFYESHPLVKKEIINLPILKVLFNLVSLLGVNPLSGFQVNQYNIIQYAVCRKI